MYSSRRDTLLLASLADSLLLLTRMLRVTRSAWRESSANPVTWTSLTLGALCGGVEGDTSPLCLWGAESPESKQTRFWLSMAVAAQANFCCYGDTMDDGGVKGSVVLLLFTGDYNDGESFVLKESVVTLFGH